MSYSVSQILEYMNQWAKAEYSLEWDNSGNQVYFNEKLTNIFVSMDFDDKVLEMAIKNNCNLIITHHPFIFSGIYNIVEGQYKSDLLIKLIENRISLFSAHTSLDIAENGVNQVLANALGIKKSADLALCENGYYIGKYGEIDCIDLRKFLEKVCISLNISKYNLYGKGNQTIKTVALCGGAGADYLQNALEVGADIFITGDVKYHDGQSAYENNILLLDIGHFQSEVLIVDAIKENLESKFKIKVYTNSKSNFIIE